jgi:hypothetical protein
LDDGTFHAQTVRTVRTDEMKMTNWLFAIFAVCLLGLAGCKKADQSVGPPQEYYGVKLEWQKLDTAFTNASPEVQASVSLAVRGFRYAQFPQALVELDKLANNPNVTEAQKKLVNDLIEQTKQVIAKAPPPPAQ